MNFGPLAPYALLLKLGLLGVLVGSLFIGGCVHGERSQAAKDAKELSRTKDALRKAGASLADARDSLRKAADTFDAINALTQAEAAAAAAQIDKGLDQAKQAKADKAAAVQRVSELEGQLRSERSGCVDAGRPICGLPLR